MKLPHPLALLALCIAFAAALTFVVPAGQYDRREDDATGRRVAVAGTYKAVEAAPQGLMEALVAVPRGLMDASSVVFFVFLVGGAFTVVDKTGALNALVHTIVARSQGRGLLALPVVSLVFAALGALENMQEEIIALVPVLLLFTRRLGLSPLVAVSLSAGSAAVGAAFSPLNPFQVLIAQKLAQLPPGSGAGFRSVFLLIAVAVWTAATFRMALRTRVDATVGSESEVPATLNSRGVLILVATGLAFTGFCVGIMKFHWDFDQLSTPFIALGIAAGLIGGLGISGTAAAFAEGFASMASAAMLIGTARAISVTLEQGRIIDTLVSSMVAPLEHWPPLASALGMMVLHLGIHIPVPSVSGQAALTMPVLVPVGDLIGLSRQAVVLAYQYGAGLMELVTPTNGAMMAVMAAAGVPYDRWIRFALPVFGVLLSLGAVAIALAVSIGF